MHPIEDGELISDYFDGVLDNGQVNLLETHLRDCQPCWEEITLMHRLDKLFSRAPMVMPPTGFAQKVLARLEEREARRGVLRVLPFLLIGALLLASVLAFSLLDPLRVMLDGYMPLISTGTKILMDGVGAFFSLCRASSTALKAMIAVLDQRFVLLYSLTALVVMLLWARLVGPRVAYSHQYNKGG